MGIALRSQENYEEAIIHFRKAKEINPFYGQAWVQLGLTHYKMGNAGLAIEEFEGALKHLPNLKEAKTYLEFVKKEKSGPA